MSQLNIQATQVKLKNFFNLYQPSIEQIESLNLQISTLTRSLDERTNHNKILMVELEKLKALLAKKEDEIISFSKKLIEKDSIISNLNIEISKHQGLKEEAKKFRQLFEDKNKDFFNLTIKFSEYEKIIIDAQVNKT